MVAFRGLVAVFVVGFVCLESAFAVVAVNPVKAVSPAGSQTIYVDDDNTQGPWEGTLEHPFQHIMDGVNHTNANDTVYVFSGLYRERVVVSHSVILMGENKSTTVIDAMAAGHGVLLSGGASQVSGFTIRNSTGYYQYGVYLHNSNRNVICDNIIECNQDGIRIWVSHENTIDHNLIRNNTGLGIDDEGSGGLITNNTISGNTGYGYRGGDSMLRQNRFIDNPQVALGWFDHGDAEGNYIAGSDTGVMITGDDHLLLRNNITGNRIGVNIDHAILCEVKENTFIQDNEDAVFSFSLWDRVKVPFIVSLQLVKWDGNYWEQPVSGKKAIYGTMILSELLSWFGAPGVSWTMHDFSPAQSPYPDDALGGR